MSTAHSSSQASSKTPGSGGILSKLHDVKIGGDPGKRIKQADLVGMLRNITTLVSNGVSLRDALETVAADRSLKRYRRILNSLSESVRHGNTLSAAMVKFPASFDKLLVNQIRVGERAGTLPAALESVSKQLEEGATLKRFIVKKLTYPSILVLAGIASVSFMLTCVIPTFQEMYDDAGATLPAITRFLIDVGEAVTNHGFLILAILMTALVGAIAALQNPATRIRIDEHLLRIPMIGDWFRNIAILQFIQVLENLMCSGFTLAEALPHASGAVRNRYIRIKLQGLHSAIRRGERFSLALDKEGDLFPPVVKQLVVIGERTGRLGEITKEIRSHLRADVEKYTTAMVGAIEPALTAVLAVLVGGILLAIYLPMFDMIGQTNQ
tara:strand:- start:235541 stop:236686 length:1146 start_codon:yes stop_codon:yes gene_type:complete